MNYIVSSKSLKYLELKLSCNDLFQNRPLMATIYIYIWIWIYEQRNKFFFPWIYMSLPLVSLHDDKAIAASLLPVIPNSCYLNNSWA